MLTLAEGTQTETLDLTMTLKMGMNSRTQDTCALTVDDGDTLQSAEDGVIDEAIHLQQSLLYRLSAQI